MRLRLSKKTMVMAILNATPDSFSDGGELSDQRALDRRIGQIIQDGADIIDIGGESTRPGFHSVSAEEEIARVKPVIEAVRLQNPTIPISIDTQKSQVAEAALKAGANIINDVSGLSDPKMAKIAVKFSCPVVIMRHRALQPNIVESCRGQFLQLVAQANQAGIKNHQIILDPGLGFGDLPTQDFKALPGGNVEANLKLIRKIKDYSHGLPVLIGGSRKRFIGEMMNEPDPKKRVSGSIEIAVLAAKSGAAIVRVHDIRNTVRALTNLQ
ncbi:dihydropteroate synthase [Candidatus Parcubacteria bacterium]|nr:dihydropteroate synthase [Candidatus Parcubacteria bacterium]